MGLMDFFLTTRQKQDKVATQIGLETGLFVSCPVCHGVTEARNPQAFQDNTARLVHQMVSERHPDCGIFNQDEAEIHKTIARVAKGLPYHCTCESI